MSRTQGERHKANPAKAFPGLDPIGTKNVMVS
jgi:hypothetical protein